MSRAPRTANAGSSFVSSLMTGSAVSVGDGVSVERMKEVDVEKRVEEKVLPEVVIGVVLVGMADMIVEIVDTVSDGDEDDIEDGDDEAKAGRTHRLTDLGTKIYYII